MLGIRTTAGKIGLWEFQRYAVEALFEHRKLAIRGPRRVGKSHLIGPIVTTFFWTAPSRVLLLSPTLAQNRNVSWSSIHTTIRNAREPLPGEINTMSVRIGADAYIVSATTKNESSVRGYHSGTALPGDPDADELTEEEALELIQQEQTTRFLIWFDEAQDKQGEAVHRALDGILGQENVYVIKSGNPFLGVDDDHGFVRCHKPGSGYHRIHVQGHPIEEYPDTMGSDKVFDHVPAYIMQPSWKAQMLKDYGEGSPTFLSDVLGQFTEGSTEDLVVTRSMLKGALLQTPKLKIGPRIGVDLGFKSDPCVASLFFNGVKVSEAEWLPDSDDMEAQETIATEIAWLAQQWGEMLHEKFPDEWDYQAIPGERISVDDTGLVGVCDNLARRGVYVDRVDFGSKALGHHAELNGEHRFINTRAEMYWSARRLLQEGYVQIPEKWSNSWQQAQWTRFERVYKGDGVAIKLEPKDDVKARHGRSPDHWDADVLAMRETTMGSQIISGGARRVVRRQKRDRAARGRRRGR